MKRSIRQDETVVAGPSAPATVVISRPAPDGPAAPGELPTPLFQAKKSGNYPLLWLT